MDSSVMAYLRRLGYPGDWRHKERAMALVARHGFPVSKAAEDMVRQYGGLNTSDHPPPAIQDKTGVRHAPTRFWLNPFEACISQDDVAEMEEFHGGKEFCPIGFCYTGAGIMCIDPMGRVYFEESAWGYVGTPTEVIVRLLTGKPNI